MQKKACKELQLNAKKEGSCCYSHFCILSRVPGRDKHPLVLCSTIVQIKEGFPVSDIKMSFKIVVSPFQIRR